MTRRILIGLGLLLCGRAWASDPVGVYALPKTVVLEPDAETATRVQIHGVFELVDVETAGYTTPQKGYVYYQCPSGMEATCRQEWNDLARQAQASDCVGFGSRRDPQTFQYRNNGSVRAEGSAAASPDPYPIAMGVATVDASAPSCRQLTTAAAAAGDPTPSPSPQPSMPPLASGCSATGAPIANGAGLVLAGAVVALLTLARRRRS
jgi:uncharacterized protein (TIGR03382 family)